MLAGNAAEQRPVTSNNAVCSGAILFAMVVNSRCARRSGCQLRGPFPSFFQTAVSSVEDVTIPNDRASTANEAF
ncbi:MAG: hypothetical protein WAN75_51645 [Xanthobacteraceae bacterium]